MASGQGPEYMGRPSERYRNRRARSGDWSTTGIHHLHQRKANKGFEEPVLLEMSTSHAKILWKASVSIRIDTQSSPSPPNPSSFIFVHVLMHLSCYLHWFALSLVFVVQPFNLHPLTIITISVFPPEQDSTTMSTIHEFLGFLSSRARNVRTVRYLAYPFSSSPSWQPPLPLTDVEE